MACDYWQRDTSRVNEHQTFIRKLLAEAQTQNNKSKNAAILRGRFAQMAQDLVHLEQSLMRASESPSSYNTDTLQLSRRQHELARLSDAKDELLEVYRRQFSQERVAETHAHGYNTPSTTASNLDDFAGGEISGQDFLSAYAERESALLEAQDEQLSFLEGSVHNLKHISHAINEEVEIHHGLLRDLESNVDRSDGLLLKNKKILKQLMKTNSTVCLLLVALVLFCILVFLLVFTA